PVAGVDAAVDPRLVDEVIDVGRAGRWHSGPVRTAPAVAGGVDEHADVVAEGTRQPLTEGLGEGQLVDVLVPVHPLRLADRHPVEGGVDVEVRLGQRRVVRGVDYEAVYGVVAADGAGRGGGE